MINNIAWAAGLFEGEGHAGIHKRKSRPNSPSLCLRVTMTDQDVINTFHSVVKAGTLHKPMKLKNKKTTYTWQCSNHSDIENILNLLMPYFGKRRKEQCQQLLDYIASKKPPRSCGYNPGKPTRYGAQKHRANGEPVCESCLDLQRDYERLRLSK